MPAWPAQAAWPWPWPWPGVTPLLALSWPFYHQFKTEPESRPVPILLLRRELHSQSVCPLIGRGAFKEDVVFIVESIVALLILKLLLLIKKILEDN